MELTIPVTDALLKKLQILNVLQGSSGGDFTQALSEKVELVVEHMIDEELQRISVARPTDPAGPSPITPGASANMYNRFSVDEGLSSEDFSLDEEDAEETEEVGQVRAAPTSVKQTATGKPKAQNKKIPKGKSKKIKSDQVSVETLLQDSVLSDPEHEAVSSDNDNTTFEDLMMISSSSEDEAVDIPLFDIPEATNTSPRPGARKLPKGCKAVVSGFTGGESNSF